MRFHDANSIDRALELDGWLLQLARKLLTIHVKKIITNGTDTDIEMASPDQQQESLEDKFPDWELNREDRRDMAALITLAHNYLVNKGMQLELYVMSDFKW